MSGSSYPVRDRVKLTSLASKEEEKKKQKPTRETNGKKGP